MDAGIVRFHTVHAVVGSVLPRTTMGQTLG